MRNLSNDIIALDRRDRIYLFEKGKPLTEIENIHWLKTDLACRKHFSNSMNCFAQFILNKDGNLLLEMFKLDSDKNDYILQWRNETAYALIEKAGSSPGQKLPDFYVSTRCSLAIKTNIGDFCGYPNSEKDAIWFYDDKGKMIATFSSGDDYFYECEKSDSATRIPGGIIESAVFSEDGTKLLIQGRSKKDVHDQVFLMLNENGEIIWEKLIPCQEFTESHNCSTNSGNGLGISPEKLRNFKTIILRNCIFRLTNDFSIQTKSSFNHVMDYNDQETIIFEMGDRFRESIYIHNLINGDKQRIATFNQEDSLSFNSLRINEKMEHIYVSTQIIKTERSLFEKYAVSCKNCPSLFRILNFKGDTLNQRKFDGQYLDIDVSDDEQILFTNSGTDFSIFRIK